MPVPAQNQQYENFIIRYKQNTQGGFDYESDETFQIVNDLFGILYVPMQEVPELELSSYSYSSIPRCYTYMDTGVLSASGVTRLHNHPYLKLQGKGTLVAVIDSGIDYLHPAFQLLLLFPDELRLYQGMHERYLLPLCLSTQAQVLDPL